MLLELYQMDHSILEHCILVFEVQMDIHLEPHKLVAHLVRDDDLSTFD